jgi:hypothetical protein
VAVTGLSGGGWQTIVLSALDTRVRLATPVAGYIGLEQRVQWHNDIGDLEQNPTDLVRFADYTWLTALLAPRPALLVYNDKDDCCFQSKRARASVYEPVAPLYQALGVRERFAFHSNADPGTHNYELDNRQQFYRFLNEQGYWVGQRMEDELPSQAELRTAEELTVGLPQPNADFCSLALMCARGGPRLRVRARSRAGALRWQARARQELAGLVRYTAPMLSAERLGAVEISGMTAIRWVLHTSDGLSLPAVELTPTGVQCTETVVAACDAGRDALQGTIEHVLARRQRVLAVDVLLTGELRIADARPGHYPMMLATVGECPLGLQAGQLCAATRWAEASYGAPVALVGQGRAMGLAALVAAALGAPAARVAALEVPISLRLLIERGVHYDACPTVFAFGLLDGLDVRELVALALPRDVALVRPEGAPARVHRELAPLGRVAAWLGGSVKVLDGAAASGY